MNRRGREYDESDVRSRPPKSSRPRSKKRPAHEDAVPGMVIAVDRGRYTVMREEGTRIIAITARELGRDKCVVGDHVFAVGDVSGAEGTLARIVRREPRRHVLRRSADDSDPTERVIVANADQLAIVVACADPEPNPRMIDRCLVAALDADMKPLLILTKSDLGSPDALIQEYERLGVDAISTRVHHAQMSGLSKVRERVAHRTTVMVGYSGVGKSTLVNALVPDAGRTTGVVNAVTGRGRHTSTSVVALELPSTGWIIDTPGVRSFGLAHVTPDTILGPFADIAQAATLCPRGCPHTPERDECTLPEWATTEERRTRLASVQRLLAGVAAGSGPRG